MEKEKLVELTAKHNSLAEFWEHQVEIGKDSGLNAPTNQKIREMAEYFRGQHKKLKQFKFVEKASNPWYPPTLMLETRKFCLPDLNYDLYPNEFSIEVLNSEDLDNFKII